MAILRDLKFTPVSGNTPPMTEAEIDQYLSQLPGWKLSACDGEKCLVRAFNFNNFTQALDFTSRVGALAEANDHHPRITTEWGKVTVSWWTHKIHGLHANDFVMAAKTDEAYKPRVIG